MRIVRNLLLLTTLTASLVLGTASLAGAQAYSGATITASPTVVPGGSLTLSGTGFPPNTPVTITIQPGGVVITGVITDASGNWTTTITAPTGTGTYTVTATAGAITRTTTFTVATGGPVLPSTGNSTSLPLAQIGVGLVAIGALVTFGVRRSASKRTRDNVNV